MAAKKNGVTPNALLTAIEAIKRKTQPEEIITDNSPGANIVDIMTFCNDERYLDLQNNNFFLYVSQRTILKTFYMGTIGNETLSLDQDEWEWLHANENNEERDGAVYEKNIKDVIRKIQSKNKEENKDSYFKELHLVLGRRSSKTVMASVITAYEAYKLLVINNGDPHGYYKLPNDDQIAIINAALSQNQAGRLFEQIQSRIRNSPFFSNRIAKQTTSEIRLYTDLDLRKKESGTNIEVNGSILLLCGHSNPDSLAGYNAILILFDEIAFFDESGKITGKYFYNRLIPSLAKFYKYKAARIVQISSPNTRNGIFYETGKRAEYDDSILSFQLPTWCVNPEIEYSSNELTQSRENSPETFYIEYGAQWATGGICGNYFEKELIDYCTRNEFSAHVKPNPRYNYYLHVDPARKGNNYCAVLVAKERYTNVHGKLRNRIYLANVWIWKPQPGIGLIFSQIDQEMLKICATFRPICVSYDDYNSQHSLQLLRSHGINTRQLSYNRSVKQKIYQNLKDLMTYTPQPELFLYNDGGFSSLLIDELKALKFKKIQRGIAFITDKHGETKTDDASDALAGACSMANDSFHASLPLPVTCYTSWK